MRLIVGLTGASGVIYGLRMLQVLHDLRINDVETIVSRNFIKVAITECFNEDKLISFLKRYSRNVYYDEDLYAPPSSSSHIVDGVIVIPCSLKTLSDIANSRPQTLISRAATNALRMGRRVVLVIRETPLSYLELLNALKASLAGAVILPASPAFYHKPSTIMDLIDFIVGKVLDVLGVKHNLYRRWEGFQGITQGRTLCDLLSSS